MFHSSTVVSNENAITCILDVIMMFSFGLIERKKCQHLQVEWFTKHYTVIYLFFASDVVFGEIMLGCQSIVNLEFRVISLLDIRQINFFKFLNFFLLSLFIVKQK